jgi:hypothetical protein
MLMHGIEHFDYLDSIAGNYLEFYKKVKDRDNFFELPDIKFKSGKELGGFSLEHVTGIADKFLLAKIRALLATISTLASFEHRNPYALPFYDEIIAKYERILWLLRSMRVAHI